VEEQGIRKTQGTGIREQKAVIGLDLWFSTLSAKKLQEAGSSTPLRFAQKDGAPSFVGSIGFSLIPNP
jgi:hypothetical protein